jgi:hypothetical protein
MLRLTFRNLGKSSDSIGGRLAYLSVTSRKAPQGNHGKTLVSPLKKNEERNVNGYTMNPISWLGQGHPHSVDGDLCQFS